MSGAVCLFAFAAFWIVDLYVISVKACEFSLGPARPCPLGMTDDGTSCWKHTYGRGTGRTPSMIRCPDGLRDDGTSCWSDADIYSKPCCCTIWGCCRRRCRSGYTDDGCTCRKRYFGIKLTLFDRLRCRSNEDLYGSLCYPKCRSGYRAVGCCLCEPRGGPGIKLTAFQRITIRSCNLQELFDNVRRDIGRTLTSFERLQIERLFQQ